MKRGLLGPELEIEVTISEGVKASRKEWVKFNMGDGSDADAMFRGGLLLAKGDVDFTNGKIRNVEKISYTSKQMVQAMSTARSWALNKPSGLIPYLPVGYCSWVSELENTQANNSTAPKERHPHWLIKLLMKIKVL